MHFQKWGMEGEKTCLPHLSENNRQNFFLSQAKKAVTLRLSLWQIVMFIEWFLITFQQKWMSVLDLRKRDIMPRSFRKAGPYLATGPLDLVSCYLLILSIPKSAFKCQRKLDRYLYFIWAPEIWKAEIEIYELTCKTNMIFPLFALNLTSKSNGENAAGGKATLCKYVMQI